MHLVRCCCQASTCHQLGAFLLSPAFSFQQLLCPTRFRNISRRVRPRTCARKHLVHLYPCRQENLAQLHSEAFMDMPGHRYGPEFHGLAQLFQIRQYPICTAQRERPRASFSILQSLPLWSHQRHQQLAPKDCSPFRWTARLLNQAPYCLS
jgi:hypothetical protein